MSSAAVSASVEAYREAPARTAAVTTVGLVTDEGGLGDRSFNDMAHAGLMRAQDDFGVGVSVLEASGPADYEPMIASLVASGTDVVIVSGWGLSGAVEKQAKRHPTVKFAGVDAFFEKPASNLVGLNYREHEAAYLVGAIAGLSTLSTFDNRLNAANTIAFIGGMDIPVVQRFEAGYIAGARWTNPRVKVISRYANAFADEDIGEELASEVIDEGADVVFAAAGATGLGCIKACQKDGALFIGVDADQYLTVPGSGDVMLTSAMKRVDTGAYTVVKQVVDSTFRGGRNVYFGLADGGVDVAPFHQFESAVPTSIAGAVGQARTHVSSRAVTVPSTRKQLRKASVGTPVAPAKMTKKTAYRVYGTLRPRHSPGERPVRVYRWRKSGSKWTSAGYVVATASDYSAYSRYSCTIDLERSGKWRLRAYHPADSHHSASWSSNYRYVTVK